MAEDLHDLRERAAALLEKGKLEKALEAYQALSQREPGNARWPQKVGELARKLGEGELAIAGFSEAARRYAEEGFLVKAIALCKVVLAQSPNHAETTLLLARFHTASASTSRRGLARTPRTPAPAGAEAGPAPATASAEAGPAPATASAEAGPAPATASAEAGPAPATASAEAGPAPTAPVAPAAAAVVAPGLQVEATRPTRRTIPPGGSLDAVVLHELVPAARREERPPDAGGEVFLIPLEDEASSTEPAPLRELPFMPLFSSLEEDALRRLIERVTVRQAEPGEVIIREGEHGDSLFVIAEGEVAVFQAGPPRRELGRLVEGAFFGEVAVLTDHQRTASVEAQAPVTLLEITRAVVGDLLDEHPAVLRVLLRFFRDRLVANLTASSELFAPFAEEEQQQLVSRFAFLESEAGSLLIREGQGADGLYLLLAGRLHVLRGGERRIAELGPGSVVGEISLLTHGPAVASIRAASKCWLLKLQRRDFQEVIMTHPQVLAFLSELADRRRAQSAALAAEEIPYEEQQILLV